MTGFVQSWRIRINLFCTLRIYFILCLPAHWHFSNKPHCSINLKQMYEKLRKQKWYRKHVSKFMSAREGWTEQYQWARERIGERKSHPWRHLIKWSQVWRFQRWQVHIKDQAYISRHFSVWVWMLVNAKQLFELDWIAKIKPQCQLWSRIWMSSVKCMTDRMMTDCLWMPFPCLDAPLKQ